MLSLRCIFRVGLAVGLFALPLFALVDNDGDGLSDIWSALHPTAGAPDLDPDGDGVINRAEAIAGTDPTSALSRFSVAPQRDGAGNLALHWAGLAGKRYRIEESTDLRNWTELPGEFLGTGGELSSVVRPVGTTGPARLSWRVVVSDADADTDGLNDWEEAQLGTDSAKPDTDDDGLLDRIEVSLGTNPLVADNPGPIFPVTGACLHLRADLGVFADGSGAVGRWVDVSGRNKDAVQSDPARQPSFAMNQLNGLPSVHFSGNDQVLYLPDLLAGAGAGEIFAVVKVDDKTAGGFADTNNKLWDFGQNGTGYQPGDQVYYHYNTFGSVPGLGSDLPVSLVSEYHIFDTTSSSDRCAEYFNGNLRQSTAGQPVEFSPEPNLGTGVFFGDFAEIIVFDRALTDGDRDQVGRYLTEKYRPAGISPPGQPALAAFAASVGAIELNWASAGAPGVATIERQTGDGAFVFVAQVREASAYVDDGLVAGQNYTYRVTLENWAGQSPVSEPVTAATLVGPGTGVEGMRLWLRADLGLKTDEAGNVSRWRDLSGFANHAFRDDPECRPRPIAAEVNNPAMLRFDGTDDSLQLPDLMAGATEGEIFVVTRLVDQSSRANGLFHFGTADATAYSYGEGVVWDDFGTAATGPQPGPDPALLLENHLFNSSISSDGTSILRFNGQEHLRRPQQTVAFRPDPLLGSDWFGESFQGDIAEVIVYDHVITAEERRQVQEYLAQRYGAAWNGGPPEPPVILTQPQGAMIQSGLPVGVSVLAVGDGPLTYQWQKY